MIDDPRLGCMRFSLLTDVGIDQFDELYAGCATDRSARINPKIEALVWSFEAKGAPLDALHPYIADFIERGMVKTEDQIHNLVGMRFALYNDIKATGRIRHPVILQVTGGGEAFLWDGNHRLQFAKQLGIKRTPIRIVTLSRPLIEIAIRMVIEHEGRPCLYQPIDHPFFAFCDLLHPEAPRKAASICDYLRGKIDPGSRIVDFGSYLGYYSRHLQAMGYSDVVAVDPDKNVAECQPFMEEVGLPHINLVNSSFEDYCSTDSTDCTVLALGILHHYFNDTGLRHDHLVDVIAPWIRRHALILIAEHEDAHNDECLAFWREHGFTVTERLFSFAGRTVTALHPTPL